MTSNPPGKRVIHQSSTNTARTRLQGDTLAISRRALVNFILRIILFYLPKQTHGTGRAPSSAVDVTKSTRDLRTTTSAVDKGARARDTRLGERALTRRLTTRYGGSPGHPHPAPRYTRTSGFGLIFTGSSSRGRAKALAGSRTPRAPGNSPTAAPRWPPASPPLGCMAWSVGFRVQGVGFRAWDLLFRAWGLGCGVEGRGSRV